LALNSPGFTSRVKCIIDLAAVQIFHLKIRNSAAANLVVKSYEWGDLKH
ncbi:hypothetical protein T02_14228, partial [Trichinella nativa]